MLYKQISKNYYKSLGSSPRSLVSFNRKWCFVGTFGMGRSLRRHKKYRKNPTRVGVKRFLKLRKLSQKPSVLKGADVRVSQRLASGGE